jgi:hypothetical protein
MASAVATKVTLSEGKNMLEFFALNMLEFFALIGAAKVAKATELEALVHDKGFLGRHGIVGDTVKGSARCQQWDKHDRMHRVQLDDQDDHLNDHPHDHFDNHFEALGATHTASRPSSGSGAGCRRSGGQPQGNRRDLAALHPGQDRQRAGQRQADGVLQPVHGERSGKYIDNKKKLTRYKFFRDAHARLYATQSARSNGTSTST